MTLRELLTSEMDLAASSALARQGLAWWLDELTAMLPTAWRERLSSRPRAWIEPRAEGGWRFWKEGRPFEPPTRPGGGGTRIGLLLPAEAVLVRRIPAPRMAAVDLRRMLTLDIDRLSPLAPDLIHFDFEIDDADGGQRVLLGIVLRADAARQLARARRDGFAPVAMAARAGGDGGPYSFDFLPQVLAAAGDAPASRIRAYGWAAAIALILVNFTVLVARDSIDVARLRQAVDGQKPVVDAVLRLRRRVETEEARRRDLLARGRRGDPLRMLNVLTSALPPGVWVRRLEWNGQTLHIGGFRPPDIDVAAAIRGSGAFANPRALAEPYLGPGQEPGSGPEPNAAAARAAGPGRPFDITADARPDPRP